MTRNLSATRIPSMKFRDKLDSSGRVSAFIERESSIVRQTREKLALQRQEERQRERYRKIEQMPLVRELEKSLKDSTKSSREEQPREQESFISFRPTSVERPLEKEKIDRERHSLYKQEIATI